MLIYKDNEFQNSPDPAPEDAAAEVLRRIDDCAIAMRDKHLAPTSPYEAASWPLKLAEAKAGGGKILNAEASFRGISEDNLVAKVLNNAAVQGALEAQISGNAGRHKDAVRAMSDADAIITYDWRAGWPG